MWYTKWAEKRQTRRVMIIMGAMAQSPYSEMTGLEICRVTGWSPQPIQTDLRLLMNEGLVVCREESRGSEPPRFLYRLVTPADIVKAWKDDPR